MNIYYKKISAEHLNARYLAIGAIMLFPLMQVYSMLRTIGIPSLAYPVLIYILFGISMMLSLLILLGKQKKEIKPIIVVLTLLLLYVTLTIIFGIYKYGFNFNTRDVYLKTFQTGVIYSVFCFLMGLNIENIFEVIKKNKKIKRLAIFTVILMIATLLFSMFFNYLTNGIFQILKTIDYLSISDGIAVTLLVLFSIIKKNKIQIFALLFFIILMMGTISRGCLLSFLAAIISIKIIKMEIKPKNIISMSFFICLILFVNNYITHNQAVLYQVFGESRGVDVIIGLLTNNNDFLENDPSSIGREEMLHLGLKDIKNVWLTGSFMRELDTGYGYIHNWLSFWVSYGIIPFLLFGSIYIISLLRSIISYRQEKKKINEIVILLGFYTLFEIIFFRAYMYPTVWFSIAALSIISRNSRKCTT